MSKFFDKFVVYMDMNPTSVAWLDVPVHALLCNKVLMGAQNLWLPGTRDTYALFMRSIVLPSGVADACAAGDLMTYVIASRPLETTLRLSLVVCF